MVSIRSLFRLFVLCCTALAFSQEQPDHDLKLPSGKSQRQEILKEEYGKAVRESEDLVRVATELRDQLQKRDYNVLSMSSIKQTEEIEKLAKRIRSRLRR